ASSSGGSPRYRTSPPGRVWIPPCPPLHPGAPCAQPLLQRSRHCFRRESVAHRKGYGPRRKPCCCSSTQTTIHAGWSCQEQLLLRQGAREQSLHLPSAGNYGVPEFLHWSACPSYLRCPSPESAIRGAGQVFLPHYGDDRRLERLPTHVPAAA